MKQPPLPQGRSAAADFFKDLAEQVFRRLRIVAGKGILISRTEQGLIIEADPSTAPGSGGGGQARWG